MSSLCRDFLQNSPLFDGLEPNILDRILGVASTHCLERDEILFHKGDLGDRLFGVLSGRIKVYTSSPEGKEVTLDLFREGQFFGEIALLDELPRTAAAAAMTPCELLVIHRRDLMPLVEAEGQFALHIIRLLCQRMRTTNEMLEDAAFLSLEHRLAKHLLYLVGTYGQAVRGGVVIDLLLSQQELAHMMVTSRETVNKQLQAWAHEGWVDLKRRRITVRDVAALEALLGR